MTNCTSVNNIYILISATKRQIQAPMAMVGLPARFGDTAEHSARLGQRLRAANIIVQKLVPVVGDRLYLRISAAVYNTIEEAELLRDTVLGLTSEY